MLKQCLFALQSQSSPCDILVIDNASTDGTKEWLDKEEIISIHMETNTGGAGGFNKGMREAVERGYEYIWVMDDDTIPQTDALKELLEADSILKSDYGWLCSVPLWKDGNECVMNRPKLLKAYYSHIHLMKYGIVRAEHATFVSLFLHGDTIRENGLPIKDFFIWGDDIEFTRRLSVRKKLPCYVVGKSIVIHSMTNNVGSNVAFDTMEKLPRYKYAFRNDNYSFRQEGLKGVLYYIGKCGKYILMSLFKAKNHRLKRTWIVISQMFAGLAFNPKIEYIDSIV